MLYIDYDNRKMSEIFKGNVFYLFGFEAGVSQYKLEGENGLNLLVNVDVYEKECSVGIEKRNNEIITSIDFCKVNKIEILENLIEIYYRDGKKIAKIFIKPNFSIEM